MSEPGEKPDINMQLVGECQLADLINATIGRVTGAGGSIVLMAEFPTKNGGIIDAKTMHATTGSATWCNGMAQKLAKIAQNQDDAHTKHVLDRDINRINMQISQQGQVNPDNLI